MVSRLTIEMVLIGLLIQLCWIIKEEKFTLICYLLEYLSNFISISFIRMLLFISFFYGVYLDGNQIATLRLYFFDLLVAEFYDLIRLWSIMPEKLICYCINKDKNDHIPFESVFYRTKRKIITTSFRSRKARLVLRV